MPDEALPPTLDTELTTNIVAGYVRHNQIGADQLPVLISTVHQALAGLGKSKAETEMERTPAVPIRRSVHQDYVVCLECGWRGKMLKRHLSTAHGLTVEDYRARWNLPREHALTHRPTASGGLGWRSSLASVVADGHPTPTCQHRNPWWPSRHRNAECGGDSLNECSECLPLGGCLDHLPARRHPCLGR